MSWTEAIVESLQATKLPNKVTKSLNEIRDIDKITRKRSLDLSKDEAALLEELKAIIKEHGQNFDEAIFRSRADALIGRRRELSTLIDDQQKKASAIYDLMDEKISTLDTNMKEINHLIVNLESNGERNKKKKRKNAVGRGDDTVLGLDTNEPKYCLCNKVSYGMMIGCDNTECKIEWFHLPCVGLSKPVDPWWCPLCRTDPDDSENLLAVKGSETIVTLEETEIEAVTVPATKIEHKYAGEETESDS